MGASRIISLHTILGLPDHFLRLLYGAPQVSFFSYNMGAPLRPLSLFTICPSPLKSVSLHAIGGPPQILFFLQNIWALPPQISFSAYYMGRPQVIFFAYYMGPPEISFCAYFLGAHLRSVFSLTIWGLLRSFFFAYYMGGPSDQFNRILYGGPLRSVSSPTI